ncbi:hypothetical protein [Vibrio mediterranei]|uniref:hypothetical protein n=1 Tax=Vibrio mediterranei TaxID=689 RepID=UPI0040677C42
MQLFLILIALTVCMLILLDVACAGKKVLTVLIIVLVMALAYQGTQVWRDVISPPIKYDDYVLLERRLRAMPDYPDRERVVAAILDESIRHDQFRDILDDMSRFAEREKMEALKERLALQE